MATCKDCLSYTVCAYHHEMANAVEAECPHFKEESKNIVIPCKIGDTVWAIRNYKGAKHPQSGVVGEMFFMPDMSIQIVVKHIARGAWGETIFPSYEAAEHAIEQKETRRKTLMQAYNSEKEVQNK